jgi:hypothetical protein
MGEPARQVPTLSVMTRGHHREPEDDFVCIRYQMWYPSFDCAIRTRFQTSDGCRNCDQGLFNLKRHAAKLRTYRFPIDLR